MFLPTNITLKFGDSGDFVSELQRRLSIVKYFDEAAINGYFDGVTMNSVSRFQSMSGIQADGVAGPETLRRLNGAISGDFAGSSPAEAEAKRREEEAQLLLQQQRQQNYLEEQALLAQQQQERAYQQQMQQQAQQQAAIAPEPSVASLAAQTQYQPPAPPQTYAAQTAQPYIPTQAPAADQPVQTNQPARAAAPTAGDILAQMLLASAPQQPVAQPQPAAQAYQAQPQPSVQSQPAAQAYQAQPQSQAPQPYAAPAQAAAPITAAPTRQQALLAIQTAAQPQSQAPQPYAAPAQAAGVIAAAVTQQQSTYAPPAGIQQAQTNAEQPKGLVGRAAQYANQMVQKLASYFEEKLPSHVINEVKEIGQTMAKAGMKEATIPAGLEQQRGVDAPGKSQSQGKQLS